MATKAKARHKYLAALSQKITARPLQLGNLEKEKVLEGKMMVPAASEMIMTQCHQ
jgi:hypothetical protein